MKKTLVIFIVLMLTLMSITVFAAGGQGGGSNALTLESSSISDKDTNIKVDAEIELEFSNNVVNKKVSEINKESIWLKKDGQEVAIEIIMADDQVEPTLKRIIKVKPVESFEEGANYVLVLGKDLQSKNGITLGQAINIAFTTESKGVSSVYLAIATCIIAAIAIIFFRKNAKK